MKAKEVPDALSVSLMPDDQLHIPVDTENP